MNYQSTKIKFWQRTMAASFLSILCMGIFIPETGAQNIRLGLKAVPSLAWMRSNSPGTSSDGFKMGFTYGLVGEYFFTSNYAFSGGIDVTYNGGSLKILEERVTFNQQYVQIPLTLKMETNQVGYFKYFAQAGASVNILLKSNREMNSTGLSLVLGGGIEFPFTGKTSLFGGFLFNNAFTDALPGADHAINNHLGLQLGIIF